MKHLLLTTIAAVILVGCGNPEADRALLKAAKAGNIEAVKQHLAAGADLNAIDRRGWTPLHFVAVAGNKEIAELLINNGADVNENIDAGWTPLHLADNKEVAELLIAIGADVNAKANGKTPLDGAITFGKTQAADLLRKHGGKTGEELKAEGK